MYETSAHYILMMRPGYWSCFSKKEGICLWSDTLGAILTALRKEGFRARRVGA